MVAFFYVFNLVGPRSAQAAPSPNQDVDSLLQSMTLDEKAGQVFMVSIFGFTLTDTATTFLKQMMPGAVALFTYNGNTPADFTRAVNGWQKIATTVGVNVPLLVATDQEGGPVTRLSTGFTPMPWGAALGAMPTDDAYKVGAMSGQELAAVGINMNLAPVVDVRSPIGQFIERRTLGPDPGRVGAAAVAFVKGMDAVGVIGVLKHFPGHGPATDSHASLPTVTEGLAQVESTELAPFREAIQDGVQAVMVGHLVYPALDPSSGLPASLSPIVIGNVLRGELGFSGVAITDAMDMGAIDLQYTRPVAAVMAIKAGADMIASGPSMGMKDQMAMKQAIIAAVQSGDIPEARLDEAVRRVLALKAKYNLLTWTALDPNTADKRVNVAQHEPAVEQIYQDTISVVQDNNKLIPLTPGKQRVTVIYPGIYPIVQRDCAAIDKPYKSFSYSLNPSTVEQASARSLARDSDAVIIFTYNITDNPQQADLVNAVPANKAIVVSLQDPYDIEQGIQPGAYVAAFNSYPSAFKAICPVLYGQHPAVGVFQIPAGE